MHHKSISHRLQMEMILTIQGKNMAVAFQYYVKLIRTSIQQASPSNLAFKGIQNAEITLMYCLNNKSFGELDYILFVCLNAEIMTRK